MGVLGILNSVNDAVANPDAAVIVTDTTKFDTTVTDMAWHLPARTSGSRIWDIPHNVASGDVTWYHFAMTGVRQEGADDGGMVKILDASDAEILWMRIVDGFLAFRLPGPVDSERISMTENPRLMRLDVKIDFGGAGITVTVYVEASLTPSTSVTIASSAALTNPANFQIVHTDSDHIYISELYAADFDTRNTRPVRQNIDASGNHSEWQGDETDVNDDDVGTSILALAGDKSSFNVEAYPGPATPAGINRVVAKIVATKGASGPTDINPFVRVAGADDSAGNIGPSADPTQSTHYPEWSLNPDTGVGWVSADMDTTEIGVEAIA